MSQRTGATQEVRAWQVTSVVGYSQEQVTLEELARQGVTPTALSDNSMAMRCIWPPKPPGVVQLDLVWNQATADSMANVSVCEGHADGTRILGSAVFRVLDVLTYDGGVLMRVQFDWSTPLRPCTDVVLTNLAPPAPADPSR